MKRIFLITFIVLATFGLNAQKDTSYYKHEVRVTFGESMLTNFFWLGLIPRYGGEVVFANVSLSYYYRPYKWLWVGGSFVNYLGELMHYNWREYDVNGNYRDFTKSKLKYCAAIAPEIRFSYLNKKHITLYSALSVGVVIEDGYESKLTKYPNFFPYFHVTCFGFSGSFGKKNNIFLGFEAGAGMRGCTSMHVGYRF